MSASFLVEMKRQLPPVEDVPLLSRCLLTPGILLQKELLETTKEHRKCLLSKIDSLQGRLSPSLSRSKLLSTLSSQRHPLKDESTTPVKYHTQWP
jgi:hypothetical protein